MGERKNQRNTTTKGKVGAFKECIIFLTLLAFLLQPMLVIADGPIADPNAGANRPRIDTTANGIPLVQITNPSAAGVSRNKYTQYNVDPHGVILNNSLGVTLTQQGGYVPGNPYLTTGTAKIILNEVTGSGRSMLNGFTEVAGQKADVVIANPNGITCNGCGFINTGRGVLTTGTPVFGGSGSLDAFRVTRGDISIQGAGLDARGADALDIITRSVTINTNPNAGIWANELNIITGSNLVNYGDLSTQVIAADDPAAPAFSIDVAALGGMYANKIRLVGTEAGVGVRNSGALVSSGDFTLTSGGQIINNGLMIADQLTITGTSLVNDGPDAVIATRNENGAARFLLSDSLFNNNNAWIYSMGDIVIAAADNGDGTYTNAASILNQSATIEAARDIRIAADTVTNQKQILVTAEVLDPSQTTHFSGAVDIPPGYPRGAHGSVEGYISASADYNRTTTVTQTLATSTAGQILAARDMSINATDLNNVYSTIAAGNNLDLTVTGTLSNVGRGGFNVSRNSGSLYMVYTYWHQTCRWYGCWSNWPVEGRTFAYPEEPLTTTNVFAAGAANISAGNALNARVGSLQNITLGPGTASTSLSAGSNSIVGGSPIPPDFSTIPPGGIFRTNPTPNGPLVETDPRFTNLRLFMSSDYMLARLGYDPLLTQKRLGDGFYEQKLVTDEITHATGRRFLSNYASAEEQYRALMDAGITYAKEYNLTVGVGLTAAQMAQLTSDMVWLVEKTVNGQKVLAPVVYLSKLHANDLAGSGALMAARDISLKASNDLANSGIIKAGYRNQIFASNITNIGGVIDAGGNTELTAAKDIVNKSGTISGGNVALSAGRDIRNETATETVSYKDGSGSYTRIGKQGSIVSTGDLSVSAGRDLTIAGGNVTATGDASLNAGRDLTITTVQKNDRLAVAFEGGSHLSESTKHMASNITTGNNLTMTAGNNASLAGAQVTTGNDLSLKAGGDVSITEVKDRKHYESNLDFGKNGYLRTKSTDETVVGSNLSAGGNVSITATGESTGGPSSPSLSLKERNNRFLPLQGGGRVGDGVDQPTMQREFMVAIDDGNRLGHIAPPVLIKTEPQTRGSILVQGSSIKSKSGSINLNANKDITVKEAREYHEDLRDSERKSNGGILFGSSRTTTHDLVTKDLAKGSTISGANVVAQSEGNITLQGNSTAASGDVALIAKGNVSITEARDNVYEEHRREEVNKGGIVDSLKAGVKMMKSGNPNNIEAIGNIAPKDTAKTTNSTAHDQTVKSANIQAKRNVTILAGTFGEQSAQPSCDTPPSDPNKGNILVRGGKISSDTGGISLAATNNISIEEARELHDYQSSSWEKAKGFNVTTYATTRESGKQDLVVGSTLSGNNNISIASGSHLKLQGSSIASNAGAVNLSAQKDITIREAREYHESVSDTQTSSDGGMLFGSSKATTHDLVTKDLVKGSSISGANVTAQSEGNITIQGARIASSGDAALIAKGNVSITEAKDNIYEEHRSHEVSKGGIVQSVKAGAKMMSGTPKNTESMANVAPKQVEKVSNSTAHDQTAKGTDIMAKRNLTILAGQFNQQAARQSTNTSIPNPNTGNILVRGSNIMSDSGAITLAATNNIHIQEAREAHDYNSNSWENTKRFDANTSITKRQTGKQDLAVGSTLSGDTVTMASAKDMTIQGSNVMGTGDVTLAAGENLNIITAQETDHQEFDAKMTRFGVSVNFNKSKGTYGYSVGTNTENKNEIYDSVNNVGSMVGSMSGNVDVSAGKDLTILGSQVLGKGNVDVNAGENVSILSAENSSSMVKTSHSKFTGYTYTAHASGLSWQNTWGSDRTHGDQSGSSKTNVASTVGSQAGSLAINAGKDARIKASNVFSDQSTDITAKNVTVEAGYDTMDGNVSAQHRIEQLALNFKIAFTANGKNVGETWQKSNQAKDERAKYMYRYQAISSMMNGPVGVGASLSLSYNTSRQQSSQDYHQAYAVGSTLLSNGDLNITAFGNKEKTEGDITFIGSRGQAKNITLDAARDISLLAAKNTSDNNTTFGANESSVALTAAIQANSSVNANDKSGKSDNSGSSIGWSISLTGSTNASNSEISGRDVANVGTQLAAAEKMTLISGRDTNIKGAQASADTIRAKVGRNLNLESLQDSSVYRGRDESQGGSFTISYGKSASSGSSGSSSSSYGASGSYTFVQGKTDSEYRSVNQQSGLFAGKGGYDIHVGENTDLKGAVIASKAHAKKNKISTKTLTYSDIDNKAEYSSSKYGGTISAGYSSGTSTSNSTGKGTSTGGASVGVSPIIAMPSGGDAASRTRAAISAGTIEVRGDKNQNLASLSRDTDNAHQALGKIFDLEKIQRQQEVAQAFGEVANQAVGDLAKSLTKNYENAKKERAAAEYEAAKAKASGDQAGYDSAKVRMDAADAYLKDNEGVYNLWKDGGLGKIALHAAVGAVQSGLGGGDIGAGALAGLASEAAVASMDKILQQNKIYPGTSEYDSLMKLAAAVVGAGVGAAVSGDAKGAGSGASTALANIQNNFLGHLDREELQTLRKKGKARNKEENERLAVLEAADQWSDGLIAKDQKQLTQFEQQNLDILYRRYAEQDSDKALSLAALRANGNPDKDYNFPYAGSSQMKQDWMNNNATIGDRIFGRDITTNEQQFISAMKGANLYPQLPDPNYTASLLPTALAGRTEAGLFMNIGTSSLAAAVNGVLISANADLETRAKWSGAASVVSDIGTSAMLYAPGLGRIFGQKGTDIDVLGETQYVYEKNTGQYRDLANGQFVSPKNLPWPPNDGFAGTPSNVTLYPGTLLDRFGSLRGDMAGELGASISERGLPPGSEGRPYSLLRVEYPITVPGGPAAAVPEFSATGGANQYQFKGGIQRWIDKEYLKEIK